MQPLVSLVFHNLPLYPPSFRFFVLVSPVVGCIATITGGKPPEKIVVDIGSKNVR